MYKYLNHTENTIEELKNTGVYCIFHKKEPNKFYVGSTSIKTDSQIKGLYQRMRYHFFYAKKGMNHNKNIQYLSDKYGVEDFVFKILEIVNGDFDEIRRREQYWIDKLDSFEKGLNSVPLSTSNKGIKMRKNGTNSKKICLYDLKGKLLAEFPSAREAERITKINYKKISSCCIGKLLSVKGKVWRFKGDDFYKFRINELGKCCTSKILQKDTDGNIIKEWSSLKEASENLNISIGNMSSCLYGRRNSAGGFKFEKLQNIE